MKIIAYLLKSIVTLLAAWSAGRVSGLKEAKIKELKGYAETSKKIDSVESMSDPDAAAEWLRQRAKH
jgi:hypothetical protein